MALQLSFGIRFGKRRRRGEAPSPGEGIYLLTTARNYIATAAGNRIKLTTQG